MCAKIVTLFNNYECYNFNAVKSKNKSEQQLWSRRQFLDFMGRGSLVVSIPFPILLQACQGASPDLPITPLKPSLDDDLLLVKGLEYKVLIKQGDPINTAGDRFGDHNDFIAFMPVSDKEADLWVNHEDITSLFISGTRENDEKLKEQVDNEMSMVGGSLIRIVKNESGYWELNRSSEMNKRIDANSEMTFADGLAIAGSTSVIGTLGNCSGGVTPWNTILTCEENTAEYFGNLEFGPGGDRQVISMDVGLGWERYYPRPPEHYGWVVEINPISGEGKKLVGLGRFAHECATLSLSETGIPVVYTGDDENDQCLYKFIAAEKDSLDKGTLYVANLDSGTWVPIDYHTNPVLQEHFSSHEEMMIRCREAAKIVGGSPLDCPEDIAIDPVTGAIVVSLTNNIPRGDHYGSLLKITEKDGDPLALRFESETMVTGGRKSGFVCPDNLCFDSKGNLWLTTDISSSKINKEMYAGFGNNSLFVIPMSGKQAGIPIRIATAPVEAELTGLAFNEDESTLFVSVQHPGYKSTTLRKPTSRWPEGGDNMPKSSVVMIRGEAFSLLNEV